MKRHWLRPISTAYGRRLLALGSFATALAFGHSQAQPPQASPEGMLYLTNGDRLRGRIAALDADQLTLLHPMSVTPIVIPADRLYAFTSRTERPSRAETGPWLVSTRRGHRFCAQGLELTGDALTLSHPWLGTVRLARHALQSAERIAATAVLYAGPRKGELWWFGAAQRALPDDRAEIENPAIPVGFIFDQVPPRSRLDAMVDVSPAGLSIFWLGEDPQVGSTKDGDCYQLQLLGNQHIMLFRQLRRKGSRQLSRNFINLDENPRRRRQLTWFTDLEAGRLAIMVDNQLIGEWKDLERFENPGRAIAFRSLQGRLFRVSHLQLREWDGRLPSDKDQYAANQEDVVIIQDRDTVSGSMTRIAEAVVHVETLFGSLSIPLDRVTKLYWRTMPAPQTPEASPKGIYVSLRDGTEFVAQQIRRDGDRLIAQVEEAGAVRLTLEHLRSIHWKRESGQKKGQGKGAAAPPVIEDFPPDDTVLEVW